MVSQFAKDLLQEIRIFVERDGRPFNYLTASQELSADFRRNFVQQFISENFLKELSSNHGEASRQQYVLQGYQKHVDWFIKFHQKEQSEQLKELASFKNNRQFITEVFYDVLDKGLCKVKELKPSDPYEFLSDFVFNQCISEKNKTK